MNRTKFGKATPHQSNRLTDTQFAAPSAVPHPASQSNLSGLIAKLAVGAVVLLGLAAVGMGLFGA